MDQMPPQDLGHHIVQVYPQAKGDNPQIIHISHPSIYVSQGKVTYQQTSHQLSAQHEIQQVMAQNQVIMTCQATHLQNVQPITQMQQVLQAEVNQIQLQPHTMLAPTYKQHVIVSNSQQTYYENLENFLTDHYVVTKDEPGLMEHEKSMRCESEDNAVKETAVKQKRNRSRNPNPSVWACNVRKLKHQRGEAYISRRGKYVPEKQIRNTKDCCKKCKNKCMERINDTDREHIFKAFYSLNANEKRHFLLNTTERHYTKQARITNSEDRKRKYSFKYFFLVRAVRYVVCKNFYLGTLAISQKPVYNVHLSKTEINLPKPDGRGTSETSTHALPNEVKDRVRNHIMSYKTVDSKPIKQFSRKKQFLDPCVRIKQMYAAYFAECDKDGAMPVKESMYRKICSQEFNIHFKKLDQQLCGRCKGPVKKKT